MTTNNYDAETALSAYYPDRTSRAPARLIRRARTTRAPDPNPAQSGLASGQSGPAAVQCLPGGCPEIGLFPQPLEAMPGNAGVMGRVLGISMAEVSPSVP